METLNSIGFVNMWGVTPAVNIMNNEYSQYSEYLNINITKESTINILINNSNDFRHVIKTVSCFLEQINKTTTSVTTLTVTAPQNKLHFYFFESNLTNIARMILFINIINDTRFSIRDRVEFLMEIYGNTLLSARTALYLEKVYKDLIKFITNDDKYTGSLKKILDYSQLTFKERDDLSEIFQNYSSKLSFDIEKYRDDRLRYHYKDRYDYRDNLADWDYNMNMRNFAGIVKSRHYYDFRRTGVSFELRICKYNLPNRTMCSYIPGREVSI
jgi:dynein assembly factor 3